MPLKKHQKQNLNSFLDCIASIHAFFLCSKRLSDAFYQIYATLENKIYVVGFTGEEKNFSEYEALATEILRSFVLKKE
ncbi:MAG: hypothetical protein ACPG5B_16510 [Chitinophagales bacterium]